jgi:hypothetical protein
VRRSRGLVWRTLYATRSMSDERLRQRMDSPPNPGHDPPQWTPHSAEAPPQLAANPCFLFPSTSLPAVGRGEAAKPSRARTGVAEQDRPRRWRRGELGRRGLAGEQAGQGTAELDGMGHRRSRCASRPSSSSLIPPLQNTSKKQGALKV